LSCLAPVAAAVVDDAQKAVFSESSLEAVGGYVAVVVVVVVTVVNAARR
jgi:hypothetical protein